MEKSKLKSLLLRNSSILGTFSILNKSEGGGGGLRLGKLGGDGGGGEGGGKKLLLLLPSPLLKNSSFSQSLFSLNWISKSLTSGVLSKNLLKSFQIFTNIKLFYQRTNYGVLSVKMFYIFKQKFYRIFISYVFWNWFEPSSEAGLV